MPLPDPFTLSRSVSARMAVRPSGPRLLSADGLAARQRVPSVVADENDERLDARAADFTQSVGGGLLYFFPRIVESERQRPYPAELASGPIAPDSPAKP